MPKCLSRTPVCRVSSAAISAHSDNTARARGDRSPKLPIGVATTYSRPGGVMFIIIGSVVFDDSGAQGYGSDLSTSTAAAVCGACGFADYGYCLHPAEAGAGA